jgi:hypothetical protein
VYNFANFLVIFCRNFPPMTALIHDPGFFAKYPHKIICVVTYIWHWPNKYWNDRSDIGDLRRLRQNPEIQRPWFHQLLKLFRTLPVINCSDKKALHVKFTLCKAWMLHRFMNLGAAFFRRIPMCQLKLYRPTNTMNRHSHFYILTVYKMSDE